VSPAGLLAWVLLLAAAAASAIALAHSRHESRRLFIELTRLERERDEINVDFGRLQLERATWVDANRIEKIARGDLGMGFPAPTATQVIRR
jgi:cell division protein FtsL